MTTNLFSAPVEKRRPRVLCLALLAAFSLQSAPVAAQKTVPQRAASVAAASSGAALTGSASTGIASSDTGSAGRANASQPRTPDALEKLIAQVDSRAVRNTAQASFVPARHAAQTPPQHASSLHARDAGRDIAQAPSTISPGAADTSRPQTARHTALLAAADRQQRMRDAQNAARSALNLQASSVPSMPSAHSVKASSPATFPPAVTPMASLTPAAVAAAPVETLTLSIGQAHLLEVGDVKRVALGSGRVLQANWLDDRQILLIPEAPGDTTLHLWLRGGAIRKYQIHVTQANGERLAAEMNAVLGEHSGVRARALGDRILLEGDNPTEEGAWRASELAGRHPQVVNLVTRRGFEQMISLEVKLIEIGRNQLKNLGVRWQGGNGAGDWAVAGPSFGVIGDFKRHAAFLPNAAAEFHKLPTAPYVSPFAATAGIASSLSTMIDLMVQNGDAAVLAEPRLSARSGGKARFVAGGELPIPVVNGNGSANVEFKEYGVRFEVEPVLNDQGVISAALHTEVSSIDDEVQVMGVPGLRKQSANTDVNLRPGETLVIAGMVRSEMSRAVTKVPGLGDLPVLGHLFRSKRFRQRESEMVVLITPRLSSQGQGDGAVDSRARALEERARSMKKQFDMLD